MPNLASPSVVSIRAVRVQIPLWTPFTISCGGMDSADNILLFATDAEGRVGVGEAAPFPVLTHDDAARSLALCNTLGAELCGRTPDAALRRLTEELWPEAANQSITACVGIELALWDLLAQQHSLSLSKLWRQQRGEGVLPVPALAAATESAGPTGAPPSVWTDITLPIMDPSSVRTFWSRFAAHGFPYIKVKVGSGSVAEDVDRILQFQRDCVPSARFSVDGNQAYQIDSALQLLRRLEQAGITPLLFEQPLPADDWEGMIKLTARSPVPICADETVTTVKQAKRLLQERAAHMLNLKFMKSGVRETLAIIELATKAQLPMQIGGMVESEVAMTASLHAVCSTSAIAYCDLDTPFFFAQPIAVTSPYSARSARLVLPQGTGLGLQVRDTYLSHS